MNEICSIENTSFQFFSLATVKRLTISNSYSLHLVDVHRDMPVSEYFAFSWIKGFLCNLFKFTVTCGAQILQASLPVQKRGRYDPSQPFSLTWATTGSSQFKYNEKLQ